MSDSTSRPWDRLEVESEREFSLFREYLLLGKRRKLNDVAITMGLSYDWVAGISSSRLWKSRSQAYDTFQDNERHRVKQALQHRLIEDELTDYKRLLADWRQELTEVEAFLDTGDAGTTQITRQDYYRIVQLREQIAQIGRRAVGLPNTVIVENTDPTVTALPEITADDLRQLDRELASLLNESGSPRTNPRRIEPGGDPERVDEV